MGVETIVTILIGIAGVAGGYAGGKRTASGQSVSIAVETVELLKTQVEFLERENSELKARVEVLESLVTQRAEVEAVKTEVVGVRGVVDRIAAKVGA